MSLSGLSRSTTDFSSALAGDNLGDTFFDARGRRWRLFALSNSLTNSTTAVNEVYYVADTSVTYPIGQSGKFTVTNTRANAVGGANAYALFAGICDGVIAQATDATAANNRFILLLVSGRHNVSMIDSTASYGDYLIHSGNGTADKVVLSDVSTQTAAVLANKIGRAMAAASASVVDGWIQDRLGGI